MKKEINIVVRYLNRMGEQGERSTRDIALQVYPSDTVGELISKVNKAWDGLFYDGKFLFAGKQLENGRMLQDYDIQDNAVLHLVRYSIKSISITINCQNKDKEIGFSLTIPSNITLNQLKQKITDITSCECLNLDYNKAGLNLTEIGDMTLAKCVQPEDPVEDSNIYTYYAQNAFNASLSGMLKVNLLEKGEPEYGKRPEDIKILYIKDLTLEASTNVAPNIEEVKVNHGNRTKVPRSGVATSQKQDNIPSKCNTLSPILTLATGAISGGTIGGIVFGILYRTTTLQAAKLTVKKSATISITAAVMLGVIVAAASYAYVNRPNPGRDV